LALFLGISTIWHFLGISTIWHFLGISTIWHFLGNATAPYFWPFYEQKIGFYLYLEVAKCLANSFF
jgi:hypothetical protein